MSIPILLSTLIQFPSNQTIQVLFFVTVSIFSIYLSDFQVIYNTLFQTLKSLRNLMRNDQCSLQVKLEDLPELPLQDSEYPSSKKSGVWDRFQSHKYYLFLYHHIDKFRTKSLRKSLKIFKLMAFFIQSRSSSQCRTHHQNLIGQAGKIQPLVQNYIKDHPQFLQEYEQIKENLDVLEDFYFCEKTNSRKKINRKENTKQTKKEESSGSLANETIKEKNSIESSSSLMNDMDKKNWGCQGNQYPLIRAQNEQWLQCFELFKMWVYRISLLLGNSRF